MGWISKTWKKYIWNPIKKVTKKAIKGIGDFFSGAANFIGSLFGWNMNPDPGDYNISRQQGTTVNKQGGDFPIPLVYSPNLATVGGHLVHMSTSGDSNKFLHLTYVVGYGPVSWMTVEDTEYEASAPGNGISVASFTNSSSAQNPDGSGADYYNNNNATYGNTREHSMHYVPGKQSFTKVYFDNGSQVAPGNRYVTADWHNDKIVYKGLATVKLRLEWPKDLDTEKYTTPFTGIPQFKFMIDRYAPHRLTSAYKTHPVNVLYDLLRSKTYGLGIDKTYIDTTSFTAALNDLNWDIRSGGTYRIDTTQPIVKNIQAMLYTLDATLIWKDNKFYFKFNPQSAEVGFATNSTYNINTHTIQESEVIGGIAYETPPEDQKYKLFTLEHIPVDETVQIVSEIDTDSVWYKNLAPTVKNKIDLNARATGSQAITGLANIRLADSKIMESHYGSTVSLTLGAKHSNIEVYDIINLNYARANLSGARYVVLDVEHTSLETVNVRAIRYLYDNDAEGLTPRDILAKLPTYKLFRQGDGTLSKAWLAVPTGFGLDNNTQVDQFLPQARTPNTLEFLKVTTSPEFFKKVIDNKGRPSYTNRVKVEWSVTGSPNNTRYAVSIKKFGDQQYDRLFETNEQFAFIDNLEDLAIYYVRVSPLNQSGYGVGRVNRFTTLDSSGPDVTNSNKEFLVTDENGVGDGVETLGSGPENDTYADAVNIFSSAYTNRTNRPIGHSPDNFEQPGATGYEETYKQLLTTQGIGKVWNDFDWDENGGAGSRTDGYVKIESTDQLSPDFTDTTYPTATEANFNARIGTWDGTAWQDLADYRAANGEDATILTQDFRSCIWLSSPLNRAVTLSSFEMPVLVGGTEDTGVTSTDAWFEGKIEVAPDTTTSGYTSGDNVFYSQPNAFVYMYSTDTNDNITTFPWYKNTASTVFNQLNGVLTDWGTSGGDSRVYDSGGGFFSADLMTGVDFSTYSESNYASGTKSKALPINAGRYVTPVIMFPYGRFFGVRNYNFKIKTEQSTHTFKEIDTSTLSGSVSGRTFTWTNPRFGRIKSVVINTHNSSSVDVIGYLTTDPVDNTQSITFKCINTQNDNASDAVVDIIISGYPEVKHVEHTDTLGNTKYIEYKSNFEGTL